MNELFDDDDDTLNNGGLGIGPPYEPYEPPRDPLENLKTTTITRNVNINLNYECPECGGRFASWDTHDITHFESEKQCPFCHTKKGEYGEDTVNDLREENEQLQERVDELEEQLDEVRSAFD